ncbi:MAG: 50S ribosomal protein L28 [Candidatus Kerfeldbacteria bacterium]|nr:50S ribosomal protein L28 [Candidatus Kerfeldbacteria bacterium]
MARKDELTGRGALSGNSRSHSNIATKRKQQVNLQKVKIKGKTYRVSTRTLRTLIKQGKIK